MISTLFPLKSGNNDHAAASVFASFLDSGGGGSGGRGSVRSSVTGTETDSDVGVIYQDNPMKTPTKSPAR